MPPINIWTIVLTAFGLVVGGLASYYGALSAVKVTLASQAERIKGHDDDIKEIKENHKMQLDDVKVRVARLENPYFQPRKS